MISALSIYLVMQTMEAVIFRTLLLSIPSWLSWRWAMRAPAMKPRRRLVDVPRPFVFLPMEEAGIPSGRCA